MVKKVALVLSSGGPRGFAYIGGIEELTRRGYVITSIAGASAGALVGGIYAAGGMDRFKQWISGLTAAQVVSLMDPSFSRTALVKGERLIREIRSRVPEVDIENLPIPYTAVSTDLYTGEEVLLRKGPLFDAIRASISIPSMFTPMHLDGRTLIDGGITNTFPLNRVQRTEGDILVGFNVNEIDAGSIRTYLDSRSTLAQRGRVIREEAQLLIKDSLSAPGADILERVRKGTELLRARVETIREDNLLEADSREKHLPTDADGNVATILDRSFGIMNCALSRQCIALTPPDILVSLPYDSYQGVYGYSHAAEIIEKGRSLMAEALDRYEADLR